MSVDRLLGNTHGTNVLFPDLGLLASLAETIPDAMYNVIFYVAILRSPFFSIDRASLLLCCEWRKRQVKAAPHGADS
jgi:hypothetical protein